MVSLAYCVALLCNMYGAYAMFFKFKICAISHKSNDSDIIDRDKTVGWISIISTLHSSLRGLRGQCGHDQTYSNYNNSTKNKKHNKNLKNRYTSFTIKFQMMVKKIMMLLTLFLRYRCKYLKIEKFDRCKCLRN